MKPLAIIFDPLRDQRELYREYFEWAKVDVKTATSAADAIALGIALRPDIIIGFVDRPDAAGNDLYGRIRQTPELLHVPVLLLTTSLAPVNATSAADEGPVELLLKPALPEHVLEAARRLMRHARMRSATKGLRHSALKATGHAAKTIARSTALLKKFRR